MAPELSAVIVNVQEDPKLLPEGGVEPRLRIRFMVGTFGPFTLYMAKAEFTAEKARALVNKEAAELRRTLMPL